MKKNRIIAGLSAIMMGATMMASTAMSASAISINNTSNPQLYGGFYYLTDDGTYEIAPTRVGIDMYDDMISSATYNSGTDDYTLNFQTVYSNTGLFSGNITSIVDPDTSTNILSNNQATLQKDKDYEVVVTISTGIIHWGGHDLTVQFRTGTSDPV